MLLNFIGRGSAFNVGENNNSAYLVRNNKLLLIDCGEDIFENIIKKNLLNNIINVNVLITHLDSDHVGSLSSLIYYCYYIKHINIDVYFSTKELYELLKLQGHSNEYNYHIMNIGKYNLCDMFYVMPIKVKHIETLNCFGYLLNIDKKIIWYSGDCSEIPKELNQYNISEYYQDTCSIDYDNNVHLSISKLCQLVPYKDRNKFYCMHIDSKELIEKIKNNGFNVVIIS